MGARASYLRLGGSLLALAAGAAGVVVAIALLRSEPGPISTAAAEAAAPVPGAAPAAAFPGGIATPQQPGFPAPPHGAIVLAREAGDRALGFAIVPGGARSLVRVSVVSPSGPGAAGLHLAVSFGSRAPVDLAPCGAGCYQRTVATGASRRVTVLLDGRGYGFELPRLSSPPGGAAIVTHAANVWKGLKSLVWHESLAASPTERIHTLYVAVAPNELAYTIKGASYQGISQSILIGPSRWDRALPDGRWQRSSLIPIVMPLPFWYSVSDARLLGSGSVGGQSVWRVSFFDPTTPAWFEADIAKRSGRTLVLSMIAASHFMYDIYGPFNSSARLVPPTGGE